MIEEGGGAGSHSIPARVGFTETEKPDLEIADLAGSITLMHNGDPMKWYFGRNKLGKLVATTSLSSLARSEVELLLGDLSGVMTVNLAGYVTDGAEVTEFFPMMISNPSGLVPDLERDSLAISGVTALTDYPGQQEEFEGKVNYNLSQFMDYLVNMRVHFLNFKNPQSGRNDNMAMVLPDPKRPGRLLACFFMSPNLPGAGTDESCDVLSSCLGVLIDQIAKNAVYGEYLRAIRARKDYPPIPETNSLPRVGQRTSLARRLVQRLTLHRLHSIDDQYMAAHLNDARVANVALSRLLRIDNPFLRQKLYELYALAYVFTQLPREQLEQLASQGSLVTKQILATLANSKNASLEAFIRSCLVLTPDFQKTHKLLGMNYLFGLPGPEDTQTALMASEETPLEITMTIPKQEQMEMMSLRDSYLAKLQDYLDRTDVSNIFLAADLLVSATPLLDNRQSQQVHRFVDRVFTRIYSEVYTKSGKRRVFLHTLRESIVLKRDYNRISKHYDETKREPTISEYYINAADIHASLVSVLPGIPLIEIEQTCNSISAIKKRLNISDLDTITAALDIIEWSLPLIKKRADILTDTQRRLEVISAGKSTLLVPLQREKIGSLISAIKDSIRSREGDKPLTGPRDLISELNTYTLNGAITERRQADSREVGVYRALGVNDFISNVYQALNTDDPYALDVLFREYQALNYVNCYGDIFSFPFPQDISITNSDAQNEELDRFRNEQAQARTKPGEPLYTKQADRVRLAIPLLMMIDRLATLGRDNMDELYRNAKTFYCWDSGRLDYAFSSLSRMGPDEILKHFSSEEDRRMVWNRLMTQCVQYRNTAMLVSADIAMVNIFNSLPQRDKNIICAELFADLILQVKNRAEMRKYIFSHLKSESLFRKMVIAYLTTDSDGGVTLVPGTYHINQHHRQTVDVGFNATQSIINNLKALQTELDPIDPDGSRKLQQIINSLKE